LTIDPSISTTSRFLFGIFVIPFFCGDYKSTWFSLSVIFRLEEITGST
jgi:hypothetical protein